MDPVSLNFSSKSFQTAEKSQRGNPKLALHAHRKIKKIFKNFGIIFQTYGAVHMPTAHMSTDGCEALSGLRFFLFLDKFIFLLVSLSAGPVLSNPGSQYWKTQSVLIWAQNLLFQERNSKAKFGSWRCMRTKKSKKSNFSKIRNHFPNVSFLKVWQKKWIFFKQIRIFQI